MMHSSKSLARICFIWAEQCFSDQFRTWVTFPSQIYIDCMFPMMNILSKTVSCCASEREIIPWIILHLPQINLRTPFDAKTKTIPQHSWNPIFQTSWLCDYVSINASSSQLLGKVVKSLIFHFPISNAIKLQYIDYQKDKKDTKGKRKRDKGGEKDRERRKWTKWQRDRDRCHDMISWYNNVMTWYNNGHDHRRDRDHGHCHDVI